MGNIIYSADELEQVINLADKWWSNVGEKEAFSIVLASGAPGPGAPIVVRILPMRQTLVLIF
jgi:hypothetical protein